MKQVIEHGGRNDMETDLYWIDGSRKGQHLTRESLEYINNTMRQGEPDIVENGIAYRIVNIGRATDSGSMLWTYHARIKP
jgi:hypothetical protein